MRTLTRKIYSKRLAAVSCSVLAAACLLSPVSTLRVSGQVSFSYDVQHSFWLYPGYWPGWSSPWYFVPQGSGRASAGAWAYTPGFAPQFNNQNNWAWMPPTMSLSATASAVSGPSVANANANVSLNPLGLWGLTVGSTHAWGNATVGAPGSSANAWSSATYTMWGGSARWRYGWLTWRPFFTDTASGSASAWWPRRYDPLDYQIFDESGSVLEQGKLLEAFVEGDGTTTWQDGLFTINPDPAGTLTFAINIDNPYVPEAYRGNLLLAYEGNVVTQAEHTGQYSSWALPEVGTVGPASFSVFDIEVPWDFGRDVDAQVSVWGGTIPEPGGLALFGLGVSLLFLRRVRKTSER